MGQDGEDSLDLENLQTQRVPDKLAAELMQDLETEGADSDSQAPRKGATVAALVPPPAEIPLTELEEMLSPRPPTASAEMELDVPAGHQEWKRWAIIISSVVGLIALGVGLWSSFVKVQDRGTAPAVEEEHAMATPEPQPARERPGKAPNERAANETKRGEAPMTSSKAVPIEPQPVAPADDEDTEPEDVEADEGEKPEVVDAAAVAKAIKRRQVRGLDNLLVSYASRKRRSFANAEAYCENLDVAGVTGWRLPEIGELFVLSRARLVRRYIFWSNTLGDTHGDRRLTWNARRRRIRPLSPKWRGGRVVCVRSRA